MNKFLLISKSIINNKKLMINVRGGHFLKRDYSSTSLALGGINNSIVFN